MAISYNLINVAYLYFYCYKIFAIKPLWKWISMHPSEDISSSSLFKLLWFVCKPTTGFAPNWSGKIQHWLQKIWARLPIDGCSKFPWHKHNMQTLNTSWKLYCCFSREKQHFVSFITKQSFLLTFESTIDCSAFTMNSCLFFLHLIFFWKLLLGSFLVLHLLYNQSEVLVRSGQILHSSLWHFLLLFLRRQFHAKLL